MAGQVLIFSLAAWLASAVAVPEPVYKLPRKEANFSSMFKSTPSSNGFQNVGYWGQNDAEASLATYCSKSEGLDIIVLSFISSYGDGKPPTGNFGSKCQTSATCSSLEQEVRQCKQAGKKIFVSLGGAAGAGTVTSQADGEQLAASLWSAYGNPVAATNKSITRPLGQQFVDGFDIDVEANPSKQNENYQYLVHKLRELFASDPANTYYVSAAPQCPIPEPNMGAMIAAAKFDMLFVQFYNNEPCSANLYASSNKKGFDFDAWYNFTNEGASKGAKIMVGVPGSPTASTGDAKGAKYYLRPSQMAELINEYKSHPGFGGVMMWDVGASATIHEGGCSFAGNMHSILTTGKVC